MLNDFRYAFRQLLKDLGFAAVAVFSLALGIGANTAIFSLVNAILLKRLPVRQPEQLVVVATEAPGQTRIGPISSFSYPVYRELRDKNAVFSGMFAHNVLPMSMSGEGQTERVLGELVSGNFFSVLGVNAHLGCLFTETDDQTPGAHPVAVISYDFWRRRFGADPEVVGKRIRLNGYPFTVMGVSSQGFQGVQIGVAPDVRIPIMMTRQVLLDAPALENRWSMWLAIMARLKPGVTLQQAQAAADTLFQAIRAPEVSRIRGDSPDDRIFKSLRIHLGSAQTGASTLSRRFSQPLLVLMCVVATVLLIACLNVANLLLARSATRQKEIAVRLALGAGRWRLTRHLLIEGFLLSTLGGMLGLVFALWGADVLLGFLPQGRIPTVLEIKPDLQVLGFLFGITLLTGLIFSLAPALQATRPDLIPALKNETVVVSAGNRKWEMRRVLVVLQVALSLMLLVGAGLFVRSLRNLKAVDDGYSTDQVVMLALDPGQSGYKLDQLRSFYARLSERVSVLPGVKSATYTKNIPLSGRWSRIGVEVPGYQPRPDEEMAALFNQIAPQFFATFGMTLLSGHDFSALDTPDSSKVVIINEKLAHYFFGTEDAVGKRISLENLKDLQIIGVVADAKYRNLREQSPQTVYLPLSQSSSMMQRTLCVRTSGTPHNLIAAIRREVRALDPNLPVFDIKTFEDQVNESVSQERLVAMLSSFFGFFALLLASLGLYGVMAYAVARRTREIGIRMALGARAGNVLRLVLGETLLLVLIGIALGLPAALAATRLTEGLLFGLTATDPFTIALATLVMIAVASLAGWMPARRAARVDPMVALRYE